ncbi:DNA methyltransferase [Shinella zoogloeoides]|uniref:Methyltransferase n=1 Tax=Shinella zoogloeoides TaxID=352475 RepID=A0A6N8TNL8_SHIZO|nr:DNA methyltransferase [Shinella zoogloeoides]MXO02838.1 DNA methylase [Shinella zoogloeoides]UEX84521.1 DNA methylase [Shinella zoogloeoides]
MSPVRPRAENGHLVFDHEVPRSGVLQGDCLTAMPSLPGGCVDLVLTDPPYVCGYRDRSGRTVANDTCTDWLVPAYAEIYRVMKPGTLCITFYGWTATDSFMAAWRAAGFRLVGHLVFCKDYASRTGLFRSMHENAYVLAKGRAAMPAEALSDVRNWVYTGNKLHPTEKSVEVLKPLIRAYCPEGGLVFDPFAGSGSTLVAARDTGREYLGIELDPDHAATAARRLR